MSAAEPAGFRIDDRMSIATAEGVTFEVQLAGIGSRGAAALVDGIIQFVLGIIVLIVVVSGVSGGTAVAVSAVSAFVIVFGYHLLFEGFMSGRTPGKSLIGVRVATVTGAPPGFAAIATRNLLRIVDFLPSAYGFGVLSMMFTARRQRLGDLAAGTVVIVTKSGDRGSLASAGPAWSGFGTPGAAWPATAWPGATWAGVSGPGVSGPGVSGPGASSPGALSPGASGPAPSWPGPTLSEHPTDTWDVSRVSTQDVLALRQLFARRHDLPPGPFAELCATYAQRIRPLVSGGEHLPPEHFLGWLLEAKRRR